MRKTLTGRRQIRVQELYNKKTVKKVYILPVPVQLDSCEAGALVVLLPDDPDCLSHLLYLKGQCHEIFYLQFFLLVNIFQAC